MPSIGPAVCVGSAGREREGSSLKTSAPVRDFLAGPLFIIPTIPISLQEHSPIRIIPPCLLSALLRAGDRVNSSHSPLLPPQLGNLFFYMKETAAAADGQPGEISKVIQHVKEAIAQHRRHPSNLSAPDSDISSSGTFVDKGSCEELNRVGRPEDSGPEHSEPEPKPVESEEVAADIVAKASHDSDILKPPESAFSTSDISEQMSGPVK